MATDEILITGATGFVGNNLYKQFDQDTNLICASRNPEKASERYPKRNWVQLNVHDYDSIRNALEGCKTGYYLIHEMASGEGYKEREKEAARNFAEAATKANLDRIIYLGGIKPQGDASEHLSSRIETGKVLRQSDATVIEIRCSMIIGARSASWLIVRDLSARLPTMILPRWTQSEMEPIYIDDVTKALVKAHELKINEDLVKDLPGPEVLTAKSILNRTAKILGQNPMLIPVPILSPKLSSLWLRFVTRADYYVATQLVEGLRNDVLSGEETFWDYIDENERMDFETATRKSIMKLKKLSS